MDSFLVKVVHDNHVECLRRIQSEFADIVNSTITLQLSCPNLPMQAVFTVFVTATNKVGNVTLSSQYGKSTIVDNVFDQCRQKYIVTAETDSIL